ncbi:hypothetical protein SMICM17S_01161 [Streptomyces microflavus]
MLRGFVKAVPEALEEAAYIDGASRTRFLWQILFPLVFPGLVATSVFSFITTWNDFLFAKSFIISDTSQSTLPMALLVFFKPDENDWGGISGSLDGDDHSRPRLLRTRTATPRLRTGRSGKGRRDDIQERRGPGRADSGEAVPGLVPAPRGLTWGPPGQEPFRLAGNGISAAPGPRARPPAARHGRRRHRAAARRSEGTEAADGTAAPRVELALDAAPRPRRTAWPSTPSAVRITGGARARETPVSRARRSAAPSRRAQLRPRPSCSSASSAYRCCTPRRCS